jgi:hypothetical protein
MYQIDKSFTRLQSAIDFSSVAIDETSRAIRQIGNPPAELVAVHCPSLLNAWHARLCQAMDEPTQTEVRKGHRRVQVLGNTIFDFDDLGVVHAWRWSFNTADLPALTAMPDRTVVAEGSPYQSQWITGHTEGFLRSHQAMHPGKADRCKAYAAWATGEMLRIFGTEYNQSRVRQHVEQALALDPQVLASARQIKPSVLPHSPVPLQQYNRVLQDRTRLVRLASEAPGLVPLYELLAPELEESGEVAEQMKRLLADHGVRPAMWRLLHRVGTGWIESFLDYFDLDRQTTSMAAIEILLMAQAFGTAQLVPAVGLHALVQLGGNPNGPRTKYANRLNDQFPLCKRFGHLWIKADKEERELLQEHAHSIFNWASSHLESVPASTLRRASAQWLVRTVREHAMLDEQRLQGARSWSVPYAIKLKNVDVSAVILDNPLSVWQEGQTMRHCANNYAQHCARGELIMVSLRRAHHHHPLATVTFGMKKGAVSVHKYSGFANQKVSPEVQDLISQCRRQLVSQRRRLKEEQPSVMVVV